MSVFWSYRQELLVMGAVCLTLQITKQSEYVQSLHCCEIISKATVEYKVLFSTFIFLPQSLYIASFFWTERRGEIKSFHS